MKERFKITGLFYENGGFRFRKFLNIIKKDSNCGIPDLMVIMMNPGSSRPLNGIDSFNIETETVPDRTQDQIMKLMDNCGYNYARILNLSDLREPKSGIFYTKLEKLKELNIHHSIFSDDRWEDFDNLFIKNVPVILAWGVNNNLMELAAIAKKRIGRDAKSTGIRKVGEEYAYYHPLPQNYSKQEEWVETITNNLKDWSNH
jgi:hypothetical protein